jgi:hypothetical protein
VREAQSTLSVEFEYISLSAPNSRSPKPPGCVESLNRFLDEGGFMHSKGCITNTVYFHSKVKSTLLLPKRPDFIWLVVADAHAQCNHLGIRSMVSWVHQQGYWIP